MRTRALARRLVHARGLQSTQLLQEQLWIGRTQIKLCTPSISLNAQAHTIAEPVARTNRVDTEAEHTTDHSHLLRMRNLRKWNSYENQGPGRNPAAWGHGIGYEALGLWCDYLFKVMPTLARLDLRTWSGNPGMMRLAQKLGYKEEACFRKARIVRGRYYDRPGYGMLREEWDARYPGGFVTSLS